MTATPPESPAELRKPRDAGNCSAAAIRRAMLAEQGKRKNPASPHLQVSGMVGHGERSAEVAAGLGAGDERVFRDFGRATRNF
jgi:hypothetical protein